MRIRYRVSNSRFRYSKIDLFTVDKSRRSPPPPSGKRLVSKCRSHLLRRLLNKGCSQSHLTTPTYGTVKWDHVGHGGKATFGCNSGYKISGVATRTCNNGHWSGSNPNCILGKNVVNARKDLDGYVDVDLCFLPACTKPNNPSNGRVQIELTYAQYTCNGGFKLIGSQKRQCVGPAWNGYAPWCAKSKSCDDNKTFLIEMFSCACYSLSCRLFCSIVAAVGNSKVEPS